MTTTAATSYDVFATERSVPTVKGSPFVQQCHHVAITSFEQIRSLINDYVGDDRVEVVSIIEHGENGENVDGACSAYQGYIDLKNVTLAGVENSDHIFRSCEDMPDRETEKHISHMLNAGDLAGLPLSIIYKSIVTSAERATVAFAFVRDNIEHPGAGEPCSSQSFSITGLADSFIYVALQYCLSPRQSDTFFGLAGDLLTRAASQILVQKVSKDATGHGNDTLYGLCCDIAAAQYEGRAGLGSFIFSSRESGEQIATIKFRQPVHTTHKVGVRKLIEMASDNLALLFDGNYFWGFTSLKELERHPHVSFMGRGLWSIQGQKDLHCLVSYGVPVPRERVLLEDTFKAHLRSCFPMITQEGLARIWQIATLAVDQPVGTNILFTPEAAREAKRLSSQCIPINPIRMTPELTLQLTAIDGTVIVDLEGNVHAVGAIMDGPSTTNGTWQRGGRYNSAANFVSGADFPALIFIVSQDGYVDIAPPVGQKGPKWKQRRYLKLSSTAI